MAGPSKERRRYSRVDQKFVVRVSRMNDPASEWNIVTTRNLSAIGVLFTFDEALEKGTELLFKIHFLEKTIECSGVVVRTSPGFQKPLVNVAAKLDGLSAEEKSFISRFSK